MTIRKQSPPATAEEQRPVPDPRQEPGTNAVEHEPDPQAQPIPDGEHKYVRRSPYTAGNY